MCEETLIPQGVGEGVGQADRYLVQGEDQELLEPQEQEREGQHLQLGVGQHL